ncbi:hypothetical protein [Lichenihabitans psoromatis]|uniref:hypothetical protein n=1 Tax=Lichenihabitans psoromatis TaxID=2528642 RepID=UPI001036B453|nr:hypothetical protein [Lichenihabitans psoromatis]
MMVGDQEQFDADGGNRNFVATMNREEDSEPLVVRFVAYDDIGLPGRTISIELRSCTEFADAVTLANLLNTVGLTLRIENDPRAKRRPTRRTMVTLQ